jgi:hypothetical protein
MIKAFKAFFLGRQLREKLLLVVFVAVGVIIWLSSFKGRAQGFWQDARTANATLATQASWLSKSDSIEARSKTAVSKLDPLRTYNDTRLFAEINRLGKEEFGNNVQVTTEASKQSGQFAIYSVTANINATKTEADWQLLWKFYQDLQKLFPYISLEDFRVTTSGAGRNGAGGTMSVRLRATSIEVAAR